MTDQKLATVDPISEKISWNAHAALGDALQRCPIDADLYVCWMTTDGKLHWSKACTNAMAVYMMQAATYKVIFDPQ